MPYALIEPPPTAPALTIEQQRALALAGARLRLADQPATASRAPRDLLAGREARAPRDLLADQPLAAGQPSKGELLQELARRGKLPAEWKPYYDEAVKRGLIEDARAGPWEKYAPAPQRGPWDKYAPQERRQEDSFAGAGSFLTSVAEGVPLVGPAILGGLQRAGAYGRSLRSGEPYEQELATVRDMTSDAQAEHPYLSTAGNVAGAVAGLAPVAATGAGAMALGLRGGSLLGRAALGGASGATIGGADSAVRSEGDPTETAKGAAFGAAGGAFAPPISQAVGAIVRSLVSRAAGRVGSVGGAPASSVRRVAQALIDDSIDPATLAARRAELGPDALLANAGENLRTHTERLAQMPGPQMNTITNAVQGQVQGSGARVRQGVDSVMGQAVDIEDALARSRTARSANAREAYGRAFAEAAPVDTSGVLNFIDAQLRPGVHGVMPSGQVADDSIAGAMTKARRLLEGASGTRVGIETLHQAQQELADMADSAARAGRNRQASLLRDVRSQLMELMNTATARNGRSLYGEATRQFADESAIMDALGEGQGVFAKPFRAAQLNQELQRMSPDARQAYVQGARDHVAAIMDAAGPTMAGNADSQTAWKRLLSEENLSKMRLLFGDEATEQIRMTLTREAGFGSDANRILQNSATARREAAKGLYPNPSDRTEGVFSVAPSLWGRGETMALGAANLLRAMARRGHATATNRGAADLLTRPLNDPVVEALVQQAMRRQSGRALGQASGEGVQRVLSALIRAGSLQGRQLSGGGW